MKPQFFLILSLVALPSAVLAETGSKVKSESIDAQGTKTIRETTHSDERGMMGTRTITSDSKITVDPKGLNNETSRSVHSEKNIAEDGTVTEKSTTIDEAGTKRTVSKKVEQDIGKDGSTVTTHQQQMEIDPKGLGNKKTVKIEEKVTRSPDGKISSRVERLNGETVSAEGKTE